MDDLPPLDSGRLFSGEPEAMELDRAIRALLEPERPTGVVRLHTTVPMTDTLHPMPARAPAVTR